MNKKTALKNAEDLANERWLENYRKNEYGPCFLDESDLIAMYMDCYFHMTMGEEHASAARCCNNHYVDVAMTKQELVEEGWKEEAIVPVRLVVVEEVHGNQKTKTFSENDK